MKYTVESKAVVNSVVADEAYAKNELSIFPMTTTVGTGSKTPPSSLEVTSVDDVKVWLVPKLELPTTFGTPDGASNKLIYPFWAIPCAKQDEAPNLAWAISRVQVSTNSPFIGSDTGKTVSIPVLTNPSPVAKGASLTRPSFDKLPRASPQPKAKPKAEAAKRQSAAGSGGGKRRKS